MIRRKKQADGRSVTYTRGDSSLSLTAWLGRTLFSRLASPGVGGAAVEWGDRDYLVAVADLTLGEPALGDRITETINGTAVVFEVLTPDTGEPAWRYSDPTRTVWRIHTKRVT